MPIQVKRDIKKKYGFGTAFSLKDIPNFTTGSVLNRVRADIADMNWDEFHGSWTILNAKRDILKTIAHKFSLPESEDVIFNNLWHLSSGGQNFQDENKVIAERDLADAYTYIAKIANGTHVAKPTFDRMAPERTDDKIVIFSDFHMTKFENKKNYFLDFNYDLYLDVLDYYSGLDYCLIENGDVEECVIYEPTETDSFNRNMAYSAALYASTLPSSPSPYTFPITQLDTKWDEFMDIRYAQRAANMDTNFITFTGYYSKIKSGFIQKGKYVRLAGNHDTYLDEKRERDLKIKIENQLGATVYDVVRIKRNNVIKYVVTHGHQFDETCMQHGEIPFAKSVGESISECTAWAFQGPDRAWTTQDTKKWYIGKAYQNIQAKAVPGEYNFGNGGVWDLLWANLGEIKQDSRDYVETLLGHQIAWEYFENKEPNGETNGFNALTLEVFTGEEMYKFRHTNEVDLCLKYKTEYNALPGNAGKIPPTLILGHTHEPRKNSINPNTNAACTYYMNSGSAGRYENLIWCVEVLPTSERICSWSRIDGKLKKINWRSSGDQLVYDDTDVEWITI